MFSNDPRGREFKEGLDRHLEPPEWDDEDAEGFAEDPMARELRDYARKLRAEWDAAGLPDSKGQAAKNAEFRTNPRTPWNNPDVCALCGQGYHAQELLDRANHELAEFEDQAHRDRLKMADLATDKEGMQRAFGALEGLHDDALAAAARYHEALKRIAEGSYQPPSMAQMIAFKVLEGDEE